MAMGSERALAVVTGASSGIGRELAAQCLAHDFDVVVCAEGPEIAQVAEELAGRDGHALPVLADLATAEGCDELIECIRDLYRPVDALLLHAGVGVDGAFIETDLDRELDMIELNCGHIVRIAKAIVPDMVRRRQGRVLLTGSVVRTKPAPHAAVYAATRAFVRSFGEALRRELADTGVTVTVLQSGATDTHFFARADLENAEVARDKQDSPARVARHGFEAMMAGKASVLAGSFAKKAESTMPDTTQAKPPSH